MKERPILFSAPMVRAILGGRKMQTRRVINLRGEQLCSRDRWLVTTPNHSIRCPYGQPCDLLWVRETWRGGDDTLDSVFYKASGDLCTEHGGICQHEWRPSIFMPRKFARITLEIVDVCVQLLQEISEEDAIAEGVSIDREDSEWRGTKKSADCHRGRFALLWDTINRKRFPWESNPWVWAITFRVVV